MTKDVQILIAEDNEGHYSLIKKNLRRSGIQNKILHFIDGQEILDFLSSESNINSGNIEQRYILFLDIRMPKVDGIEVLRKIKNAENLKKLPVIMLTTTNASREIETCYQLGCSVYIVKPIEYANFSDALRKIGFLLSITEIPKIHKAV